MMMIPSVSVQLLVSLLGPTDAELSTAGEQGTGRPGSWEAAPGAVRGPEYTLLPSLARLVDWLLCCFCCWEGLFVLSLLWFSVQTKALKPGVHAPQSRSTPPRSPDVQEPVYM